MSQNNVVTMQSKRPSEVMDTVAVSCQTAARSGLSGIPRKIGLEQQAAESRVEQGDAVASPLRPVFKEVIVSVLLMGYLSYLIGYPIFTSDSSRYLQPLSGVLTGPIISLLAPTLLVPLEFVIGPWAWPVAQNGMLLLASFGVASVLHQKRTGLLFCAAYILSGVYVVTNTIMMDIETVVGLFAIFCLAFRKWPVIMALLLIFCSLAHTSNIAVFPMFAAVFVVFRSYRHVFPKTLGALAIVLLTLFLWNGMLGERRIFAPYGSHLLAARVIGERPQYLSEFVAAHPQGDFAKAYPMFKSKLESYQTHRSTLEHPTEAHLLWCPPHSILFGEGPWAPIISSSEITSFLSFCLLHHPFEMTADSLVNPGQFLFYFVRHGSFATLVESAIAPYLCNYTNVYFPEYADVMQAGLQYNGKLSKVFSEPLFRMFFHIGCAICLIIAAIGVRRGKIEEPHYLLAFMAILAVLIDAFVLSNLSGYAHRYEFRVYFMPVFAAVMAGYSLFERRAQPPVKMPESDTGSLPERSEATDAATV